MDIGKITKIISYWRAQGISIKKIRARVIEEVIKKKGIVLPPDFVELYQQANGMVNLYPNYNDKHGFLFYPIDNLTTVGAEFGVKNEFSDIVIFGDYLVKCWYYGIRLNDGGYDIGVVGHETDFQFITSSLNEFISLYLEDSERLY